MPKKIFKKEKEEVKKSYAPQGEEKDIQEFLAKRIDELKEYRKKEMIGARRNIESIWKEADDEYTPHELGIGTDRKRYESNEETGLRSRLVKVGSGEDWQSNSASPDLYVKVNTALAILVNQNPEAVFIPSASKYEKNTQLAYSNWKNSWEISGAKQQLKHFIFNQAKYGTGFGRTFPRLIEQTKRVRIEYYPDEPDKDVYAEKRLVKYNGLWREALNPWQVWLSEMARVGNWDSLDDWYFEKEFSADKFKEIFKEYKNSEFVNLLVGEKKITVGFYENQIKDLYVIWIPETKIVLYFSPIPNDDGKLSLWWGPWTLRDDRLPWGIGLYEIIKQDAVLYDKLANMTMDQLVLSIYKMFFHKGTDILGENGKLVIEPGAGIQTLDPQAITWLDIPGPGQESWKGLVYLQDKKDKNSGVISQLVGVPGSQTLGQDIQAKEAALQRMATPLDYICDALQIEAFISLSWLKQILSTPEVLDFSDGEELTAVLKEAGLKDEEIAVYLQEAIKPTPEQTGKLLYQEETGETQTGFNEQGMPTEQPVMQNKANVYSEQRYGLEQDDKGELIENEKDRFFRYGVHLGLDRLDWQGIVRIKPGSVLAPSKELTKRMKLDLFNLLNPAIQAMISMPRHIPALMPGIKQIIKVFEEDVKNWLDEEHFQKMYQESLQPTEPPDEERVSLAVKFELLPPEAQLKILEKYFGIKIEKPLFVNAKTGQGNSNAVEIPKMGGAPEEMPGLKPLVPRGTTAPGTTEEGAIIGATQL